MRSSQREVGIAVFKSRQEALAAVEARRQSVAAVINQGEPGRNRITHWWFCENLPALLSIVHENMVVEVKDLKERYSEVEKELWATAMDFTGTVEANARADTDEPRG